MEPNPYQAPAELDAISVLGTPAGQLQRDGKQLIVRSGVVLPMFCVKTGEPVSEEEMETRTLTWSPSYVIILILFSLLIGLLVYLLVRKKCDVTFGLSASLRRKTRKRRLIALGLAVLFFIGMPLSAGMDSGAMALACLFLFLVAVVVALVGGSPLAVAKFKQGNFWLKGCSPEFLARLE